MDLISPMATSERNPSPRSSRATQTTKREPLAEEPRRTPVIDQDDEDRWANLPCTD
jgi:hypothetical protein